MRVSLRKSRKKASDVPATIRRTVDIAAPSRADTQYGTQLAHARDARRRRPRRGREIRTVAFTAHLRRCSFFHLDRDPIHIHNID